MALSKKSAEKVWKIVDDMLEMKNRVEVDGIYPSDEEINSFWKDRPLTIKERKELNKALKSPDVVVSAGFSDLSENRFKGRKL